MRIDNICIVGGGTSGWMTAAALRKSFPDLLITLLESPSIPTVGVGESTLGHINTFMDLLDLKDEDWMAQCNATYKTSIKFTDFSEKGKSFHYPFGHPEFGEYAPQGFNTWFKLKALNPDLDRDGFAEFYHDHLYMTNANKMDRNEDDQLDGFDFKYDTAYHMDAGLFGEYLRDNLCPNVEHVVDTMTTADLYEDGGGIRCIKTVGGKSIYADVFIDCTGFKSLLLEGIMKVPFNSFNDRLLNNKAIHTHIDYEDKEREMECFTDCTAIENGWVWNIPLYNRIGSGYVWSNKFTSLEEAEIQYRNHLISKFGESRGKAATFKHIDIKHGVHEECWKNNVIAVGLSAGFIEPLESTGLMMTHENIIYLIKTLERRNRVVNKLDRDMWNCTIRESMIGFEDFIGMHYGMSSRNDTPYWNHVTEEVEYSSTILGKGPRAFGIDTYKDLTWRLNTSHVYDRNLGGIPYISAGMGFNPITATSMRLDSIRLDENEDDINNILSDYIKHVSEVMDKVDNMKSHYQFLTEEYYT